MLTFTLVLLVYYVTATIIRHDLAGSTDLAGVSVVIEPVRTYFLASEMKPYSVNFNLLELLEQEYGTRFST